MQHESVDDAERNRFLVNYVDYAFDDFGGRQPPVYPGLSTVWGSLARSKVSLFHGSSLFVKIAGVLCLSQILYLTVCTLLSLSYNILFCANILGFFYITYPSIREEIHFSSPFHSKAFVSCLYYCIAL